LCCAADESLAHRYPDRVAIFYFVARRRKELLQMTTPLCPECAAEIPIPADAMQNELVACPECGAELEIVSLNPVELDLAPEVEEDWGE
jgi:alpha-aminoadipate carrier protein LysW